MQHSTVTSQKQGQEPRRERDGSASLEGSNSRHPAPHADKPESTVGQSTNNGRRGSDEPESSGQQPSSISSVNLFAKLGLDMPTLVIMLKGSLPPTIGIAMYQSSSISSILGSIGYLTPIISVLSLAILPRGKYIQTLVLNVLAACLGTAIALLALWSSIQARLHTSNPADIPAAVAATGRPPYNSSQSAVCGVWLFANIWFVNVLRAKLPTLNIPVILYSIMTNVSMTFGPAMVSISEAEVFMRELLTAVLLGLALATGVSLIVFPISSQTVVFSEAKAAIGLFRKSIVLEREYLQGLERDDMFEVEARATANSPRQRHKQNGGLQQSPEKPHMTKEQQAAESLRDTVYQMRTLAGKLHGDVKFAKRDIAWGKLNAHDIGELFTMLRNILIPL